MANKRDTSTDLRNKHTDAMSKLSGLRSRIQQRAKELVEKQPDVLYGHLIDKTPVTVKEWYDEFDLHIRASDRPDMEFVTEVFLNIIKKIEEYNEKNSPYVQGKMFDQ